MVRFKNRYITVEVNPKERENEPFALDSKEFYQAIIKSVQQLHGDFGCASIKSGLIASYCNEITRIAIVRVRCGPHRFVVSALPLIKKINKTDVAIRTLYVGATLKHCYKVILKHQKGVLAKVCRKPKHSHDTKEFESRLLNLQLLLNVEKS